MLHARTSDRAFDQHTSHTPKFYKKFASTIPRRDRKRIFRVPNVIYLAAPPTAAWECLSLISVDKCSSPPLQQSIGIVPQLLTGGSSVVGSELSCGGSRFKTLWERQPDKKRTHLEWMSHGRTPAVLAGARPRLWAPKRAAICAGNGSRYRCGAKLGAVALCCGCRLPSAAEACVTSLQQ
jgi:hypothetical protein